MERQKKALEIDRNAPCPCGSGKKFKKCHLGREAELEEINRERASHNLKDLLFSLEEVSYGRSGEIKQSLDLPTLTGQERSLRFVDLNKYLSLSGNSPFIGNEGLHRSGGLVINPWKTSLVDQTHIYVAISDDVSDSALIHEIAHVLDYLVGSRLMPWIAHELSAELEIPVEHLEHLHEFGYWLNWLMEKYQVELDADDTIIHHLYSKNLLIKAGDVRLRDTLRIKQQSAQILTYLSENSHEIARLIRDKKGYRGVKHGDL